LAFNQKKMVDAAAKQGVTLNLNAEAENKARAEGMKIRAQWDAMTPPPIKEAEVPSESKPFFNVTKNQERWFGKRGTTGGRKTSKIGEKFNRCVKSVRQTVRARPKSTKESAAIAICTKSVLQTRGLTMKRYKKKRLVTQKKFRGGCGGGKGWCS
jgi:hypothetical protein